MLHGGVRKKSNFVFSMFVLSCMVKIRKVLSLCNCKCMFIFQLWMASEYLSHTGEEYKFSIRHFYEVKYETDAATDTLYNTMGCIMYQINTTD